MTEDRDYSDIVDGTIDAVKEAVEEDDLDLEQLLDAEKAGRNRVTLIQWIEERMEGSFPEQVDVTDQESDAQYVSMDMLPLQERTVTFFAGIVLGIVLVTALVMAGVVGQEARVSEDAVRADVAAYVNDNKDALLRGTAIPPDAAGISVRDVRRVEGTDLYRMTVVVDATIQNRTLSQDVPVYVTADGSHILFGTLFDMSQPITEQIDR